MMIKMEDTDGYKDKILLGNICLQRYLIDKLKMEKCHAFSKLYTVELTRRRRFGVRNTIKRDITEGMCKHCASKCLIICTKIWKDPQSDGIILSKEMVEIEIHCKAQHIHTECLPSSLCVFYIILSIMLIFSHIMQMYFK